MINEAKSKRLYGGDYKQYVGLLQAEICVKQDLVYDKQESWLVMLTWTRQATKSNGKEKPLAKCVIMGRGNATHLKYQITAYVTNDITSDHLYTVTWPPIETIEIAVGLKVLFVTCDGSSLNQRFFSVHGDAATNCIQKTSDLPQKIYFISSLPHLIKTTRN